MDLNEAIEKVNRDVGIGLVMKREIDRLEWIGPGGVVAVALSIEWLREVVEGGGDYEYLVHSLRFQAFEQLESLDDRVLRMDRQFANYCEDAAVDPVKLLQQFMQDVCSGDRSGGSNERDAAKAYLRFVAGDVTAAIKRPGR